MLPQVTLNRCVYKLFTLMSYILRDARTYKHTNRQTDKQTKIQKMLEMGPIGCPLTP